MANKFQKAVENRSSEILNTGKTEEIQLNQVDTSESEKNLKDFEDNFLKTRQNKTSKSKTFYFEEEVLNNLKIIAEKKGISESKLLNDILKYFFNKQ